MAAFLFSTSCCQTTGATMFLPKAYLGGLEGVIVGVVWAKCTAKTKGRHISKAEFQKFHRINLGNDSTNVKTQIFRFFWRDMNTNRKEFKRWLEKGLYVDIPSTRRCAIRAACCNRHRTKVIRKVCIRYFLMNHIHEDLQIKTDP